MNGILVVNKPNNYTSRDVVNKIGGILKTKKVGHTGTLDPIATGVLVVCIGNTTKLCELLTSEYKEYIATIKLGIKTDTLDTTGTIIEKKDYNVSENQIKEVLNTFLGTSIQTTPIYSAVKVNGKKLYEYAREGIPVTPPTKEIEVYSIELLDDLVYNDDTIEFTMQCEVSKGTYIRSLIRDIGYKLNTYGTMKELNRTKQGTFTIKDSYTVEDIQNKNYKLLSIKESLPNIKITKVDDKLLTKIKNGQVLDSFFDEDISLILDKNNKEIAIYKQIENEKVKPFKMIEV